MRERPSQSLVLCRAVGAAGACFLALGLLSAPGPPAGASGAPARSTAARWSLTSRAFRHNGRIPPKYTCDGKDVSPDLSWTAPPTGAVQLALICDDPDAPRGNFTHWVLYALPAGRRSLPEAVPTSDTLPKLGNAKQGRNSFDAIGYRGPCPPKGPAHRYRFRLYALNAALNLPPGLQRGELEKAMKGHILGQTELVGLYSR